MQGTAIRIPGVTSTDTTAPKIALVDPMEAPGSLALWDASHPLLTALSAVPADQATLPNLFWQNAAVVLGSGSEASLANTFWRKDAASAPFNTALELSGKKGIHVAIRQPVVNQYSYAAVAIATILKAYMKTNKGHTYYLSRWARTTRPDTESGVPYAKHLAAIISTDGVFAVGFSNRGDMLAGTNVASATAGQLNTADKAEMMALAGIPGSTFDSSADASQYGSAANIAMVGQRASLTGAGGHGSSVIYRGLLEDLTVSGRTHAQAFAIDSALFTREVLTAGGRYYGDTYTAPATLLA